MTQTLIVIPARMQATRLPGKPIADSNMASALRAISMDMSGNESPV